MSAPVSIRKRFLFRSGLRCRLAIAESPAILQLIAAIEHPLYGPPRGNSLRLRLAIAKSLAIAIAWRTQNQDAQRRILESKPLSPLRSVCCKNLCCLSRVCTGVRELWAADPSKCPRAHGSKMLVQGHNLRLLDAAGSRGTSSAQTRKPGQSAQAGSTQGVFPDNRGLINRYSVNGYFENLRDCATFVHSTGKSHPWTNTSVGETLEELSGPLVHTNFPRKRYGPMIGPYEFPPKFVWTNGAQSSLKVSVLTGIGP